LKKEHQALSQYRRVFDQDGSIAGKYRKMHIPDDPGFMKNITSPQATWGLNR